MFFTVSDHDLHPYCKFDRIVSYHKIQPQQLTNDKPSQHVGHNSWPREQFCSHLHWIWAPGDLCRVLWTASSMPLGPDYIHAAARPFWKVLLLLALHSLQAIVCPPGWPNQICRATTELISLNLAWPWLNLLLLSINKQYRTSPSNPTGQEIKNNTAALHWIDMINCAAWLLKLLCISQYLPTILLLPLLFWLALRLRLRRCLSYIWLPGNKVRFGLWIQGLSCEKSDLD